MQHGTVPNHDFFGYERSVVVAQVNDSAVLDVAALTHFDAIDVGSQHTAVPNADVIRQDHCANQCGTGSQVYPFADLRHLAQITTQHRSWKAGFQPIQLLLELREIRRWRVDHGDGVHHGA
jgi:hypothetical protein